MLVQVITKDLLSNIAKKIQHYFILRTRAHVRTYVHTCLTLAAMHSVSAEVTLLAMKLLTFKEKDNTPDRRTT